MNEFEKMLERMDSIPFIKEHIDSEESNTGAKIFELRMKYKLKQKNLAELISISQKTISRIENGDKGIRLSTYRKVLDYLESYDLDSVNTNLVVDSDKSNQVTLVDSDELTATVDCIGNKVRKHYTGLYQYSLFEANVKNLISSKGLVVGTAVLGSFNNADAISSLKVNDLLSTSAGIQKNLTHERDKYLLGIGHVK